MVSSIERYLEQTAEVLRRSKLYVLDIEALQGCDFIGYIAHIRRLIGFASIRNRRQVTRIRFHLNPVARHFLSYFLDLFCIFKGQDAGI